MNILSLNTNGLGIGDFKVSWIRNLIFKHKIDFVGIQESKRKNLSDMVIKRIWGSPDYEFVYKGSNGQGGGLINIWNKNLFLKEQVIYREDCLITQGRWLEKNVPIMFVNIYASQDPSKREELWNFISAYLNGWRGTAVVFGDFNDVRSEQERRGSVLNKRATENFNKFIIENNLIDVKIIGTELTWIKGGGAKMSKLDRFLVSGNFGDSWPDFEAISDARLYSDHKPIIMKQIKRFYGHVPFKFFNSWMEYQEMEDLVRKSWIETELEGQHLKLFIIMQKLKKVKEALKVWAKKMKIKEEEDRNEWLEKLVVLDKKIEEEPWTQEVVIERMNILKNLHNLEQKKNRRYSSKKQE